MLLALLRAAKGPSAAAVWVALLAKGGRYLSGTLRVPLKQPIEPLFHSTKVTRTNVATDNEKPEKEVYFV